MGVTINLTRKTSQTAIYNTSPGYFEWQVVRVASVNGEGVGRQNENAKEKSLSINRRFASPCSV